MGNKWIIYLFIVNIYSECFNNDQNYIYAFVCLDLKREKRFICEPFSQGAHKREFQSKAAAVSVRAHLNVSASLRYGWRIRI